MGKQIEISKSVEVTVRVTPEDWETDDLVEELTRRGVDLFEEFDDEDIRNEVKRRQIRLEPSFEEAEIEEAAARIQRRDLEEAIIILERAIPSLDGLARLIATRSTPPPLRESHDHGRPEHGFRRDAPLLCRPD